MCTVSSSATPSTIVKIIRLLGLNRPSKRIMDKQTSTSGKVFANKLTIPSLIDLKPIDKRTITPINAKMRLWKK